MLTYPTSAADCRAEAAECVAHRQWMDAQLDYSRLTHTRLRSCSLSTFRRSTMTRSEILTACATGQLSPADAEQLLAKCDGHGKQEGLTFKISEKGGVSVYGLNSRFPVTLYAEQWVRVFQHMSGILSVCSQALDTYDSKRPEAEVRASIAQLQAA